MSTSRNAARREGESGSKGFESKGTIVAIDAYPIAKHRHRAVGRELPSRYPFVLVIRELRS